MTYSPHVWFNSFWLLRDDLVRRLSRAGWVAGGLGVCNAMSSCGCCSCHCYCSSIWLALGSAVGSNVPKVLS